MIVYGHKYVFNYLGTVNFACPKCARASCDFYTAYKKIHVYWIPVYTTGSTEYAIGCQHCREKWILKQPIGEQLHRTLVIGQKPVALTAESHVSSNKSATANIATSPNTQPVRSGIKFCTECGVKLQGVANFCAECGKKLG